MMGLSCAEHCGILRLIDTRYAGTARGIGTGKIAGRVHTTDIRIGNTEFCCSFTVLEEDTFPLALGLDILKRLEAFIDLQKNVLRFSGDEVPFLSESEIDKGKAKMRQ